MTVLSVEDAEAILADRNVIAVGVRGDDERRRRHGRKTTFVRVFEMHTDTVPDSMPAGVSAGEIRLVGTPLSIAAAVGSVTAARKVAGGLPLTGYSLADLRELAGGSASGLTDLAASLHAAGLTMISEAPIDLLPDAAEAIRAARAGRLAVPRLTVQRPSESPLGLAALARAVQDAVGEVRAFAPLPRLTSVAQPTTGYDDVRQIAVARLLVHNIPSIQVDWSLYGPKLAQVALTMGADDIDNVSPWPGDLGRRRSPIEEIRGNIKAVGLEPVERDPAWLAL